MESAWSDEAEGAAKPAPREPGDLTVEWSDGVARLAWVAASETDIVKYRVWKKNLLKWDLLSETAELELSLTTAEVGKKMRVAVSAVDVDGLESARSATVEIVPPVAEK